MVVVVDVDVEVLRGRVWCGRGFLVSLTGRLAGVDVRVVPGAGRVLPVLPGPDEQAVSMHAAATTDATAKGRAG